MAQIAVYAKFRSKLAPEDYGSPGYMGLRLNFGEFAPGKEVSYAELTASLNVEDLIGVSGLGPAIVPGTFEVITAEEYMRDYYDEETPEEEVGGRRCGACGWTEEQVDAEGGYWVRPDLCKWCADEMADA